MTTNRIASTVATLDQAHLDSAIEAVNAYGETSSILPEYVDQIASEIETFGRYDLGMVGLSIAAAGAIRTEVQAANA